MCVFTQLLRTLPMGAHFISLLLQAKAVWDDLNGCTRKALRLRLGAVWDLVTRWAGPCSRDRYMRAIGRAHMDGRDGPLCQGSFPQRVHIGAVHEPESVGILRDYGAPQRRLPLRGTDASLRVGLLTDRRDLVGSVENRHAMKASCFHGMERRYALFITSKSS